jgi:ribosomal protein L29
MIKATKQLTQLSKTQVATKLVELKKELIKLQAASATGTHSKNPSQIKRAKKTIAQLNAQLQGV